MQPINIVSTVDSISHTYVLSWEKESLVSKEGKEEGAEAPRIASTTFPRDRAEKLPQITRSKLEEGLGCAWYKASENCSTTRNLNMKSLKFLHSFTALFCLHRGVIAVPVPGISVLQTRGPAQVDLPFLGIPSHSANTQQY